MLGLALLFLIICVVAAVLGFGAVAGVAWAGFKILFFIFLVLFILSLFGFWVRRPPVV